MNNNQERLYSAFAEALQLQVVEINDSVSYQKTAKWDSVAHMSLIAALDAEFDIMIDTDDVIDLSSVGKAKEILSKYGVQF